MEEDTIAPEAPDARWPLAGLVVVDLSTTLLGPYCTFLLAEMGASVIKVEDPIGGGDIFRRVVKGRSPEMSPLFLRVNRGKRSIGLNLKEPEGRAVLDRILAGADVFIHNMRATAARRLRLDYAVIGQTFPSIVYCECFGFGEDGPYAGTPAYDDTIQAYAGIADVQGRSSGVPAYVATPVADKTSGLSALYAILAALYRRSICGRGQRVTIPMFETMVAHVLFEHMGDAVYATGGGDFGYQRLLSPYRRPHQTADGYIGVLVYTDDHWRRFLAGVGLDAYLDDERFRTPSNRMANLDFVYGVVEETLLTRTSAEWLELLTKLDVPVAPVQTLEGLLSDPHLEAVKFFEYEEHPTQGLLRQTRAPIGFTEGEPAGTLRPAPHLGEHTFEVLEEVGFASDEIQELVKRGVVLTFDEGRR
jgi:crotonobetainyl-CoA:carnitine CoA-transferase CaiB-like acyl-CoA transferase